MSKLGKLGHFFMQVGKIAPLILPFTPLAPIAPFIVAGIAEAEAIKGATGPDKLAHVLKITSDAAQAANAAAGHVVVDEAAVQTSAAAVISAIVAGANILVSAPETPAA